MHGKILIGTHQSAKEKIVSTRTERSCTSRILSLCSQKFAVCLSILPPLVVRLGAFGAKRQTKDVHSSIQYMDHVQYSTCTTGVLGAVLYCIQLRLHKLPKVLR